MANDKEERQGCYQLCGVCTFIGLLLMVILLPMTWQKLNFYEAGIMMQKSTSKASDRRRPPPIPLAVSNAAPFGDCGANASREVARRLQIETSRHTPSPRRGRTHLPPRRTTKRSRANASSAWAGARGGGRRKATATALAPSAAAVLMDPSPFDRRLL